MTSSQDWQDNERRVIQRFFETKVPQQLGSHEDTCSKESCVQFASDILSTCDVVPVDNQGSNSFTLISRPRSRIVQFRLKPFDMGILNLANDIYGDLVPRAVFHPEFVLPVYTSNVIPGRIHFLQDAPEDGTFPLERQLRTITDLARFIARASWHPQSHIQPSYKSDSWTATAGQNLERLLNNTSLERLAPELLPVLRKLQAKLFLLDELPPVLTHNDLAEINIMVDDTGRVTGVLDFDLAGIEAFGMCVWGIYECFLGTMDKGKWSFFDQDAIDQPGKTVREILESAFWSTLWSSISPDMRSDDLEEAVKVAAGIGVINRYFISGMLDEIDKADKVHRFSLEYARGILPQI